MTALVPSRALPAPQPPLRQGRLVLDTSHSGLSPQLARRCVRVTIDELPLRLGWGRTAVDLPAGRHLIQVDVDHGRGWGPVSDAVPVAAGDVVEVFYRAPVWARADGALGPVPQPTRGAGALAALAAALVLALTIVAVGMVAFGT